LGRFELPNRSPNAVFDRGNEVLAVIWNAQPTTEQFYFGEQPVAVDLWGRRQKLELDQKAQAQTIQVGPAPLIIRNCSPYISRWRLAVQFEKGRIRSEFGQHEDALLLTNPFPQGVSGKAILHFPPNWEIEPPQRAFQAAAGEKISLPFLLTFPRD